MTIEANIEKILRHKQDLTREDILNRVKEKTKMAEGFLTDESALRIVASEFGVEIPKESFRHEVAIKDLSSGLSNVTIVGHVTRIYPAQTFARFDAAEGKVAHLLISDKTGDMKIVLWNDRADIIEKEKIAEGQTIRVSHGYTREGRSGKLELHLDKRGALQVLSQEEMRTKIAEIKTEGMLITVEGKVTTIPEHKEVTIRNEKVAVKSFDLEDETGKVRVSLWRKLAEEAKSLQIGARIRIGNAYVKKGFGEQLEITSRSATLVEVLSGNKDV